MIKLNALILIIILLSVITPCFKIFAEDGGYATTSSDLGLDKWSFITPYIPGFIKSLFETNIASSSPQFKDLPQAIKGIYNNVAKWYNDLPKEQKEKFYQKVKLIAIAVFKAIFDLIEQIIRIIFT